MDGETQEKGGTDLFALMVILAVKSITRFDLIMMGIVVV